MNYIIYFLLKNGKVVYIGHTKNLGARLPQHADKDYNFIRIIKFKDKESALRYEKRWQKRFQPIYNINGIEEKEAVNLFITQDRAARLRATAKRLQKTISIVVENALEKEGI